MSTRAHTAELRVRRQSAGEPAADWLAEIRRFRAEVFYDRGRRPGFQVGDAEFDDPQDLDLDAFHLTAYVPDREELAACVRLAPPGAAARFQVREHLGEQAYIRLLAEIGADPASLFEAGRLVVAPWTRGRGLGARMVAAVMAAGQALGASIMVCTSGTDDGQDMLFGRLGWRPCPGGERYSAHYRDTVRVLAHRVSEGAHEFETVAARLRRHFVDLPRAEATRVPL
ncbi:GNAT family N-acetyltransferase [Streptosporangium sp. NPDC049644]|uniref:GNAT family N-acetyltransferase n=1 Tax=Streptosporangium sp. NPDC049644 TaxID=3155507 RepID=UPI0034227454